jgi:serine/threonine-protein kinase
MSAAVQERGSSSNQYELLARLAEGGMAEIFLARVVSLAGFERHVVLKRIRPERDDDPRWITMFLDEARLAAQLNHPNIGQVFDLGRIGDAFFYTMEYVHGEDVRGILARAGALGQRVPVDVSLAIAAGTLAGLSHAHDRCGADGQPLGVVHRDVTPSNIMVSYEGVVKVLDFGVAKGRTRTTTETEAGAIMGKVAYLSPEQVAGKEIDQRSDIFSLGIVLYELLTSSRLFRRNTDYDTLAAILRYDPPPPSSIVASLPPEIDAVVLRALAKDPAGRFPTASVMLDAIEAVADIAGLALSPRDIKRYMRDLYGTRPEPWRELEALEERSPATYSGEVIGPLTRTVFPADAAADDVPLIPGRVRPLHHEDDDLVPTPLLAKPVEPSAPVPSVDLQLTPLLVRLEPTHDVAPLPAPVFVPPVTTPAPRRSRAGLVIGVLVLLGCAIGALVYALVIAGGDPPAARAQTTPPTPTITPITSPPSPAETTPPAKTEPAASGGVDPSQPTTPRPPRTKRPAAKPARTENKKACTDPLDCQF